MIRDHAPDRRCGRLLIVSSSDPLKPPERPTADGTGRVDDADALRRALGRLPEAQRQAVVLRHYLHLTEQQTAEATGVARGTVKSRLSRALAVLAADPDLAVLREGRK